MFLSDQCRFKVVLQILPIIRSCNCILLASSNAITTINDALTSLGKHGRLNLRCNLQGLRCFFSTCHLIYIICIHWFPQHAVCHRLLKHMFTFHVIPPHWYDTVGWNPSSNKPQTYPFYIVNIMAACVLAGARASTAMVLTWLNRDNSVPAR